MNGSTVRKKPSNNFQKLLQERIDKANPRRTLTAEEKKNRRTEEQKNVYNSARSSSYNVQVRIA